MKLQRSKWSFLIFCGLPARSFQGRRSQRIDLDFSRRLQLVSCPRLSTFEMPPCFWHDRRRPVWEQFGAPHYPWRCPRMYKHCIGLFLARKNQYWIWCWKCRHIDVGLQVWFPNFHFYTNPNTTGASAFYSDLVVSNIPFWNLCGRNAPLDVRKD